MLARQLGQVPFLRKCAFVDFTFDEQDRTVFVILKSRLDVFDDEYVELCCGVYGIVSTGVSGVDGELALWPGVFYETLVERLLVPRGGKMRFVLQLRVDELWLQTFWTVPVLGTRCVKRRADLGEKSAALSIICCVGGGRLPEKLLYVRRGFEAPVLKGDVFALIFY